MLKPKSIKASGSSISNSSSSNSRQQQLQQQENRQQLPVGGSGVANTGLERFKTTNDDEDHESNESLSLVFGSLESVSTNSSFATKKQQQQQQKQQHKRWKRLPVSDEDDYLDEDGHDDLLNPVDEMYENYYYNEPSMVSTKRLCLFGGCAVLIAALALLIPKPKSRKHTIDLSEPYSSKKIKGTPQYTCPIIVDFAFNGSNPVFTETISTTAATNTFVSNYDPITTQRANLFAQNVLSDLDKYIETFSDNKGYSPWVDDDTTNITITYNEMKSDIRAWKQSKFLKNVKTGDSIYQSGSGIGLDLLITLELLNEENEIHYVTDLHVYGNDYVPSIAQAANVLLDTIAKQANDGGSSSSSSAGSSSSTSFGNFKNGVVCAADSRTLHEFVPDDSFDLVYASNIPPLYDPLGLNLLNSVDHNTTKIKQHYDYLCIDRSDSNSNIDAIDVDDDWKTETLIKLVQELQDDWYNAWITEMIRIAKPGSAIIVEYVGQPFCMAEPVAVIDHSKQHHKNKNVSNRSRSSASTMGVATSYWNTSIERYNWDIDPNSLVIEGSNSVLFPSTYHVFMRKNEP